jgi:autotransporter translocation and assembly factor TamB
MASVADTGGQAPPSPPSDEVVVVRRRNPAVRVAKWFAIILGLIVIAVAGFLIWLNSDPGRRFIVERINNLELASGLKINVERIDGNIWSDVTLRGLTLSDPQGAFLAVPEAQVDYDLMSYVRSSHIDIDDAANSAGDARPPAGLAHRRSERAAHPQHRARHRPARHWPPDPGAAGHRSAP